MECPSSLKRNAKDGKNARENSDKFWKDLDDENKKRARRGLPPKVFETGGPNASYVQHGPVSLQSDN